MDKRNLESAHMKAQARLARYEDKKKGTGNIEELKREMIRGLVQSPMLLETVMKTDPERMKRLIERYAKDIPIELPGNLPGDVPVPNYE